MAKALQPLSLKVNFSWTLAGNIIYAISQWGILIALARLGTKEMLGQFALGLAVTAPIIQFSNLALRQVQATDMKQEYRFAHYFSLRIMMTSFGLLIISYIAIIGYQNETTLVIILTGIAKAFEALSDITFGLLQQKERMDKIARSQILKALLSLFAMIFGLLVTKSVVGAMIFIILVRSLMFFLYDLDNVRKLLNSKGQLYPVWNMRNLFQLAWLALPLGFVMLLISLGASIPRIFIERYFGTAQLGVFASLVYLLVAGGTIVAALGQSVNPRLAKYKADNNRTAYLRLLLWMAVIGLVLGLIGVVGAVIVGEWFLKLVYGAEYVQYTDLFIMMMGAGIILYLDSLAGYAITAARVFKLQLLLTGIPTLATYGLCLFILPQGTLYTAIWIMILSGIVGLILKLMTIIDISVRGFYSQPSRKSA